MSNRNVILARRHAKQARRKRKVALIIFFGWLILMGIIWLMVDSASREQANLATASAPAAPSTVAPTPRLQQWDAPPEMSIETGKQYFATVTMADGGQFIIRLYPEQAPVTVNNFVFLARQGYYDGSTFHRVIAGFMAQGGDPTGTGAGGPGYQFEDEPNGLVFDRAGLVAMANAGPDTNGSQFFITYGPTTHLNGRHTIFGEVVEGMDVVAGLTPRDPQQNPAFSGDVIRSIVISEE